jgi:hypothetical protein
VLAGACAGWARRYPLLIIVIVNLMHSGHAQNMVIWCRVFQAVGNILLIHIVGPLVRLQLIAEHNRVIRPGNANLKFLAHHFLSGLQA